MAVFRIFYCFSLFYLNLRRSCYILQQNHSFNVFITNCDISASHLIECNVKCQFFFFQLPQLAIGLLFICGRIPGHLAHSFHDDDNGDRGDVEEVYTGHINAETEKPFCRGSQCRCQFTVAIYLLPLAIY